jgi:sterol desaturase/sphingolipid hydroxylase (fatty acid hydroxylase superfamily)
MLTKILTIAIPLTFVLFHILEALVPARAMPKVRFWRARGFAWFVVGGLIASNLPPLVAAYTREATPLDISGLGVWGVFVIIPCVELFAYAFHRLRHSVNFLWRFHQMHHASERHDISGANVFHPIEIAVMSSCVAVFTWIVGPTPEAAAVAGFYGFFMSCFTHANIKTPRWLGYIIQRPESHSVHHARGVHAFNYTNLAIVDMIFGTFRNPASFEDTQGFYDGASSNVVKMLLLQDGTRRPDAAATLQAT